MIKDYRKYRAGQTIEAGISRGNELIKLGVAIMTADVVGGEYKVKEVKRGNTRKLRANKRT